MTNSISLDCVTSIKNAAIRILRDGGVNYRGHLITASKVIEYQGKLTLTTARKHLSEVFRGN